MTWNTTPLSRVVAFAAWLALAGSCGGSSKEAEAPELPEHSLSHWTETTELFMEHPSLVAGATVRLAVHLTTLDDFKPLNEGRPSVELTSADGRVVTWPGSAPLRPGAFRVEGQVPAAGTYTWGVRVRSTRVTDFHSLGSIAVFPTVEAAMAAPAAPEGPPAIAYLKEQQWTTEFRTTLVRAEPIRRSLRAPAVVAPPAGGEAAIAAPASGRLVTTRLPQLGDRVAAGTLLGRFEPRLSAVEDRALLVQQLAEARAALSGAEAEQRRADRLVAERAVPSRRAEDAERAVAVARAQVEGAETRLAQRDQTLRSGGAAAGGNAFELRAPIAGTIVAVSATPGVAYEEGAELFRIVRTDRVAIEAQFPPSAAALHAQVTDVAFEMPGTSTPIALRIEHRGNAGVLDPKLRALIVRFEVTNPDGRLLVGQAGTAVAYLRDAEIVPVVPATALLTEAGRPYLFVQSGGESFEKRQVELGGRDGDRVSVTRGLEPGERVVTKGMYDVQLASAAKGLPAEGHVH
jgi:RND family efflux transporter MFP subunit